MFDTMDHQRYRDQIEGQVRAYGEPIVTSLADDTHIFHFERDGRWRDAKILFVNRNGNHFRVIKGAEKFHFVKTWNGIFDTQSWQTSAHLTRDDPEELISLCGIGPQGNEKFESLCLLPKGTTSRRKAVWRDRMLCVQFDMANDGFGLSYGDDWKKFSGKLWQSEEASRWCRANVTSAPSHMTSLAAARAARREAEKVDAEKALALEESELWGTF